MISSIGSHLFELEENFNSSTVEETSNLFQPLDNVKDKNSNKTFWMILIKT